VTFEHAATRLIQLAQANRGTVTAAQVEADDELAAEQALVSAAARALAGGTNALSTMDDEDGRAWFPYSALTFSNLHGRGSGRRATR
jgi:hypothetical protein